MKRWKVKLDPLFERNLKGISKQLVLEELNRKIERLKINPYIGKQLRPPYSHLWEVKVYGFRLYYEILDRRRIILLKAFYPRKLQKRYLKRELA